MDRIEQAPSVFQQAEIADVAHQMSAALLAERPLPTPALDIAREHPEIPQLQLLAAIPYLFSEQFNLIEQRARPLLDQALSNETALNPYQHKWCEALVCWSMQDYRGALRYLAEVTYKHPTDLLSCKIAEFLFQMTGERLHHLAFLERLYDSNAENADFLSMYSVALNANYRHQDAQFMANQALNINATNVNALYAMLQSLLNTGAIAPGLQMLAQLKLPADEFNSSHLPWLQALFYIGNMQLQEALDLYQHTLLPVVDRSYIDLLNAISLLWNIELTGLHLDTQWQQLLPHVQQIADQFCYPMASALCLYALARCNDNKTIQDCMDHLHTHMLHQAGVTRNIWLDTGAPLCLGAMAYARGAYGEAQQFLAPILNNSHLAGGSLAQNRLIRLSHLSTLIHNGYNVQAKHLIQAHLLGRPTTAFQAHLLNQCGS